MIECTLAEMKQYATLIPSNNKKTKHGLYSRAIYHGIKGFGSKVWIVAVNIDLDYDKHASEGKDLEVIARGCVEYLNAPPKSKYGKRRKRKPLYGAFHDEPYRVYLKEKSDKKYIQALLVVDTRKRKCFWGEGEKLALKR
jgi:hypothetical protein